MTGKLQKKEVCNKAGAYSSQRQRSDVLQEYNNVLQNVVREYKLTFFILWDSHNSSAGILDFLCNWSPRYLSLLRISIKPRYTQLILSFPAQHFILDALSVNIRSDQLRHRGGWHMKMNMDINMEINMQNDMEINKEIKHMKYKVG